MDVFLTVLLILAALILLYVLWCLAEPFFLVNDKVSMTRSELTGGDISKETVKKIPFVPQGSESTPDLRFFFFSDIHTEWCPVTAKRLNKSIRKAIADTFPDAAWQRCQVHLERNILDATPIKYKEGLKVELRNMFNSSTVEEAEKIKDSIVSDYQDVAKTAVEILESGFWDSMTVMSIKHQDLRIPLRTSNIIERLNRELKRRSDVIQVFPNAESVLRLMGAVTIEYSDSQSILQRMYSEQRYKLMEPLITKEFQEIADRQHHEILVA